MAVCLQAGSQLLKHRFWGGRVAYIYIYWDDYDIHCNIYIYIYIIACSNNHPNISHSYPLIPIIPIYPNQFHPLSLSQLPTGAKSSRMLCRAWLRPPSGAAWRDFEEWRRRRATGGLSAWRTKRGEKGAEMSRCPSFA